jgi:hypothetical protein
MPTMTVHVEIAPGEEMISEAQAVQAMQDGFARLARMTVDEVAAIWRTAVAQIPVAEIPLPKPCTKHGHRRRAR